MVSSREVLCVIIIHVFSCYYSTDVLSLYSTLLGLHGKEGIRITHTEVSQHANGSWIYNRGSCRFRNAGVHVGVDGVELHWRKDGTVD